MVAKDNFYPGGIYIEHYGVLDKAGGWCGERGCVPWHPTVIVVNHLLGCSSIMAYKTYCFVHFFQLIQLRYVFFPESLFNEIYKVKLTNDRLRANDKKRWNDSTST